MHLGIICLTKMQFCFSKPSFERNIFRLSRCLPGSVEFTVVRLAGVGATSALLRDTPWQNCEVPYYAGFTRWSYGGETHRDGRLAVMSRISPKKTALILFSLSITSVFPSNRRTSTIYKTKVRLQQSMIKDHKYSSVLQMYHLANKM